MATQTGAVAAPKQQQMAPGADGSAAPADGSKSQGGYLQDLSDAAGALTEDLSKFCENLPKMLEDMAGIKERERQYTGKVTVQNDLDKKIVLIFRRSSLMGNCPLHRGTVQPGSKYEFDAGETCDFDYIMCVAGLDKLGLLRAHVVRNGVYRVTTCAEDVDPVKVPSRKGVAVETVELPPRRKTDQLASCVGLSFSFSASGWLFVYQLGVAECLQDKGILKNSDIRVSGASGGSLTAATMMYGCNMQDLKQAIKGSACKVHTKLAEDINLRSFILDACRGVVKDGSYLHPCIQNEKVYIVYSQTDAHRNIALSKFLGKVELHKAHKFKDTADIIMAMLASSTMGISGLPFVMKNSDGKEVRVADGAVANLLPLIDEFSVGVKPFSDMGFWGGLPDIMPSELVPGNYGLYPARMDCLDHLYELGYQDMESWLDHHLEERIEQIRVAKGNDLPASVPPVEAFTCQDDGTLWYDQVQRLVPVDWSDMSNQGAFDTKMAHRSIKEGSVELEVVAFSNEKGKAKGHASFSRQQMHCKITGVEILWHEKPELEEGEEPEGRCPLAWVKNLEIEPTDKQCLVITTADAQLLKLMANSNVEAKAWHGAVTLALREARFDKRSLIGREPACKCCCAIPCGSATS